MTRARPLLALALLATACGGSSKKAEPPPPDLTAPRISNPVNANVGRRDVLRVRFTEPVLTTPSTAVTVTSATGSSLAVAAAWLVGGTLELVPASPLAVPDDVQVVVENVRDAAGNVLLQEVAHFHVTGSTDLGLASGPVPGPSWASGPEVARARGVDRVVWPGGSAFLEQGAWTVTSAPADPQSVSSDGAFLLWLASTGGVLSLTSAAPGVPGLTSWQLPARFALTASVGACLGGTGWDAVVAWHEVEGPSTVVRAVRLIAGTWLDLGVVGGGPGSYAWNPAAACDNRATSSWVAFEEQVCGGAGGPCVRVMGRARASAEWGELAPRNEQIALHPALLANGDAPVLAYTRFTAGGADALVEEYREGAWVRLGVLDTAPALHADEVSMTWDHTAGGLLAAWSEYPGGHPEQARVYVKRWDGSAWTLVGNGPVNDDEPFRPARRPSIAMGVDGLVAVAFLEWDGTGTVDSGASNHRVRVKRLWR